MQLVEIGPGQLALPHAVHARTIAGAPRVGELRAVDRQALSLRQRLESRAPPTCASRRPCRTCRRPVPSRRPNCGAGWADATRAPSTATPACSSSRRVIWSAPSVRALPSSPERRSCCTHPSRRSRASGPCRHSAPRASARGRCSSFRLRSRYTPGRRGP